MVNLSGKSVLVVGGTGNVGRHLVRAQLEAGANVIVPSRSKEKLEALVGSVAGAERRNLLGEVLDVTRPSEAETLLERHGPIDGAAVSLGGFVAAPSVLEAPAADLQRALDGYVMNHFAVARLVLPHLRRRGGGYVMINGPLAFDATFPGTGLVSIATAAQAMLARVLFRETAGDPVRVNELVIYSSFGWGNDEANEVSGADIGRYVSFLISTEGEAVQGRAIHLRSKKDVRPPTPVA